MKIKILIPILLVSCSMNPPAKSIIESEDFKPIIKAIHLIEARHEIRNKSGIKNHVSLDSDYDSIFKAHNISKELFMESIDYYSMHPKKLNAIYESVLEELKSEKSKLP